jgi:hypothetical protein
MVTSFMNEAQSQYEAFVAVGGTDVTVAGTEVTVAVTGAVVGAFCVSAYMVWVTIAWTVAAGSFVACGWGLILGMANKAMGKHAMAAIAITPKRIRYEFVVSFIMHLHFVHEMDDEPMAKVPYTPKLVLNN